MAGSEWSMAGTDMIWSALQQSDQVLSVGYKPEAMPESAIRLHEVDIRSKAWSDARTQVMQIILEEERKRGKTLRKRIWCNGMSSTCP